MVTAEFTSRKSSVACAVGHSPNAFDKDGGGSRICDQLPDSKHDTMLLHFISYLSFSLNPNHRSEFIELMDHLSHKMFHVQRVSRLNEFKMFFSQ